MINNIITIVIAAVCFSTLLVPIVAILKARFGHFNKVTIRSKSGQVAEIDFSKDSDIDTLLNFTDVFLGLK